MGSVYIPDFSEMLAVSHSRGADSRAPYLWEELAGLWPLAAGGGITAYDLSGYGNHGTLTNMDPGTDRVVGEMGWALSFVANQYVLFNKLTLTQWSITAWVRGIAYGNDWIIPFGDQSDSFFGRKNTGDMYVQAENVAIGANDTRVMTLGEWEHWGTTYDGTDVRFFVNGVELGTAVASAGRTLEVLAIGRGYKLAYLGSMDVAGVSIYSRALLPPEIQDLTERPWARYTPRRRVFAAAASGAISGAAAQALSAMTQAAAGQVLVQGDAAQTLTPMTQAAAGGLLVQGDAAQTLPAMSQAGDAVLLTRGPYRVEAGDVWHPGAAAGRTFQAGAIAGDVFHTGKAAGQVCA